MKLMNVKIEDKRIRKAFDVTTIDGEVVDHLLKYLRLSPSDD